MCSRLYLGARLERRRRCLAACQRGRFHTHNAPRLPGEVVGIAGPSGAGKTTFADLLVGLFPPQQGRIAVSGMTLEGAVLAAWRAGVSHISQDPFLFHDTVRRNLAWANPQASEEEMWRALMLSNAADVVRRMEHGLDTMLGERGTLISGGERQQLALARAILRRPRLLVLTKQPTPSTYPLSAKCWLTYKE